MSFVGSLLGGQKTPAPPPPPPAPDRSGEEIERKQREERMKRAAAGRASTNLTGGAGVEGEPVTAAKKLLG